MCPVHDRCKEFKAAVIGGRVKLLLLKHKITSRCLYSGDITGRSERGGGVIIYPGERFSFTLMYCTVLGVFNCRNMRDYSARVITRCYGFAPAWY